jgi:hypothetical protein
MDTCKKSKLAGVFIEELDFLNHKGTRKEHKVHQEFYWTSRRISIELQWRRSIQMRMRIGLLLKRKKNTQLLNGKQTIAI